MQITAKQIELMVMEFERVLAIAMVEVNSPAIILAELIIAVA